MTTAPTIAALFTIGCLIASLANYLHLLFQKRHGDWARQIQLHDWGIWPFMHRLPLMGSVAGLLLIWILTNATR